MSYQDLPELRSRPPTRSARAPHAARGFSRSARKSPESLDVVGSLDGEDARDVPHFAARAHAGLAEKVHRNAGLGEPFLIILDLSADQVGHLDPAVAKGRRQRPARHRANVLLEL